MVFLKCLDISGLGLGLTAREHQLTTALHIGTQVEFGDVDRIHDLAETADSFFELLLIGEVDVVVTLHADTVDGHACVLHLLHHIINTLALARINGAVVVVDQHACGVSLTGKLEGLGDELVATEFEVTALTIGAGSRTSV